MERAKNRTKSRVRSKVEHVFAEAEVRIGKAALSRAEEKCHPTVRAVYALANLCGCGKSYCF